MDNYSYVISEAGGYCMGILLFFAILLVEFAFTVMCIVKKSSQINIRKVIYIIEFLVFGVLCVTPLIEFDLRWFLFGGILLIMASIGAIQLFRKREVVKPFKVSRQVLGSIGRSIIFFLSLVPAMLFPQYKVPQTTGEYIVAEVTYTYVDNTRTDETGVNQYVNVAFWYPENGDGTYPLVVFDHGAFGIKNSNYSVYLELASHGYVVCSIDHPGQSFYTVSEDGTTAILNREYLNEVMNSNSASFTSEEYLNLIAKWMDVRVGNMNFTLDTIINYVKHENLSIPYGLIDTNKIGLFGHSMGGATSVWVGGERRDIDAVINIDGPYFSEIYADTATDEIRATGNTYDIPILNIYSDQVWVQLQDGKETGVYAANKISKKICPESFDLYLKGAKHLTLTDLALTSPFLTYMLNGEKTTIDLDYCMKIQREAILEFFDCYLKDGPTFTMEGTY